MTVAINLGATARRVRLGLPLQGVRIIDAHAHVGNLAVMHMPESDPAALVLEMDRLGFEAICASEFLAIGSDDRRGNDQMAAAMACYPGRFLGYIAVNPNYPDEVVPEIERCLAQRPFVGLKFHPEWHDYPPSGPNYEPALAYAQERGLAVLSHTWGSASYLEHVSVRYPDAMFIAAHVGAAWNGRTPLEYAAVARRRPNVYLDTAISVTWFGALEQLVKEAGSEHVLFATDVPYIDPGVALGRIAFADLPDSTKERVLGMNMLDILARRRITNATRQNA
jgi:uncharacterized protein